MSEKSFIRYPGAFLLGLLLVVVSGTSTLVLLRSNLLQASAETGSAAELKNDRTRRLLGQAYSAMEDHHPELAVAPLETLLAERPNHRTALSLMGQAFYRMGKYQDAETYFLRQLELAPNDAIIYNNLGQIHARRQRFEDARAAFDKALEIDPRQPMVLLNLSSLFAARGDRANALKYYLKAIEIWNGIPARLDGRAGSAVPTEPRTPPASPPAEARP